MQIAKGDVLMSLDDKDIDVFYNVVDTWKDAGGASWVGLEGTLSGSFHHTALIFAEKYFVQVPANTVRILFGSKDEK
jgi:hypothetical protein